MNITLTHISSFIFFSKQRRKTPKLIIKNPTFIFLSFLLLSFIFPTLSAQSVQDIQRLKSEYEKFQKAQETVEKPSLEETEVGTGLPKEADLIKKDVETEDLTDRLKHFGYDFFTKRDTVSFWENLPTPANYLLGPGDELVISLWGETQLRQTYTINRDGKIYDSKVGLLNITGRTIAGARDYLKEQFSRVYATIKGNDASTFMDVSLGELRSINVNFVGEVKYPGVYPVHPFSTVITGLIQAGGVDTSGSLRNIQIKRDGHLLGVIDLYDYFINGNLPKNIQLRDQDIVIVPVRKTTIKVDSAVVNPGFYESQSGETIYNMIELAGGLSTLATPKIGLSRVVPLPERGNGKISFEPFYIDLENTKSISARDGDEISVRFLFSSQQNVEIIGQVKRPGKYHFQKNMTFKDLIDLSGGFEDTTFWKSVYHDQAEIIRRDPDSRYEEVIEVNLGEVFNGNGSKDIPLQNLDRVVIHANLNYFKQDPIQILGEVKIPGSYPVLNDHESLRSIVERAGGFTMKAFEGGIEIYRDTLRVAWKNMKIPLMAGDSIVVKEKPGTVLVTGEVYNPGLIEFDRGTSIKDYINLAGGVTNNGDKGKIIVIYANGEVIPKRFLRTPKVKDGVTIVVNSKEDKEPLNIAQLTTNIVQILSSLATIIVLVNQF